MLRTLVDAMRPIRLLAIFLAGLLLATPLAAADDDHDEDASDAKPDREDKREKHDDKRRAWRHAYDLNASEDAALWDGLQAKLTALRTSWQENKVAVQAICRADDFDPANATKAERHERAHCIRDGFAKWRAEHRAEIKELRQQLRELLGSMRGHAGHASD